MQGAGLREGLQALQQQGDPQRHLARPAVLAPLVGLLRGGGVRPEAARLAAALLRGLAEAGPDARTAIRYTTPTTLEILFIMRVFLHALCAQRASEFD